jgi:hypothetical protein
MHSLVRPRQKGKSGKYLYYSVIDYVIADIAK